MNAGKYARLGGISKVALEVISGAATLDSIASKVSVSREMVRTDVKQHLGKAEYDRHMQDRRMKARQMREPRILSLQDFVREAARLQLAEKNREEVLYWLAQILKATKSAGIGLKLKLSPGRSPELLTAKGTPICLRTVHPSGKTPENKIGLHRFKVAPSARREAYFVFGIRTKEPIFYIFKGADICSLQSLVLRYDALNRRSKYSGGLSRWAVLKD